LNILLTVGPSASVAWYLDYLIGKLILMNLNWPTDDSIANIRVDSVNLPLRKPVSFSTRHLISREFVIVRITTKDGIEGVGYAYGGKLIAAAIEMNLLPILIGKPAGAIEYLWKAMYQAALLLGRRGVVLRAISAVDIALWDILAKRANLPLYRLLGGYRSAVPAYFSGGYYRENMSLDDVAAEAQRAIDLGFDSIKIKVGGTGLEEDLQRIKITREVMGNDHLIAVDANNAWKSAVEALRSIRKMEQFDLWWVEEPLSPDDIIGHASLARDLLIPIATGEIETTKWGFTSLIAAAAADILQPDACVVGGVTEWLKIAHLADVYGLQVAPHWNADIHVHLAAVATNCSVVEYFDVNEDVYNFDLVLVEHLKPVNGWIEVPDRAGNGLVLDESAIINYRI
jgi:L-alanine-DL-glutamate epimerase-like enolase superfamily enzyme